MKTLEPFPEDQAAKVVEYARKLGQDAVEGIIDKIRDVFGHPEVIVTGVDAWGHTAKTKIDNSVDDITNARANLKAYWEGSAYDSFAIYVDHLEQIFNKASEVFAGMSDHLQDIATTMTDVYNSGITFIINCAAIIVEAAGGLIAGIKEALFGVAEAIANAIANFIRETAPVIETITTSIDQYRRKGQDLRQEASNLKVPETIPSSSVDADGWDVRSQNSG